ncbi:MAG: ABC transporter ATP-binding protein [Syntrophaceae bacterium]|jgi:branched-chain amino acid transport system ATP-binding protein|nr:ABC transporter ATP-binding protein [Syntrophaceae bacterium]
MPELVVENISLSFGELKALNDVSIRIDKNEILSIIGPNGAGKTSLLNCINGYYMPQEGMILFNAINLKKVSIFNRTKMGIARTFQNVELFNGATALDNILAARHIHYKTGVFMSSLYYGKALHEEIHHREIVEDIIDFLEIKPIRKKIVGSLPYGMRKRVELARALAIEPTLLLLDEPMAGMNVEEKEDMARFVIDIFEEKKIPIILIEHDMGVVMDISDRVVVLDFGKKIAEGTPEQIMHSEKVINAYLGQ